MNFETRESDAASSEINRRSVLKGLTAASAIGLVGLPATTGRVAANSSVDGACVDLLAGQTTLAGQVCVSNDAESLYVEYSTTDGWCLTETHLHVATDVEDIPTTPGKNSNPIPGQFEYSGTHDCVTSSTYEIPLEDEISECPADIVVAAHAVVRKEGSEETAWGEGERFTERGNWGMYFSSTVECAAFDLGTNSVAFEDLPVVGNNDFDYNDWVVDIVTTGTGVILGGDVKAKELVFEMVPEARSATRDHRFYVTLPGSFCEGDWSLAFNGSAGTAGLPTSGSFGGGTDEDVQIFTGTRAVYDDKDLVNALPNQSCVAPETTATLTLTFDDLCTVDLDEFDPTDPHGTDFVIGPYIESFVVGSPNTFETIAPGDVRMLTVPIDWKWPYDGTAIWTVYGDETTGTVTKSGNLPVFQTEWWLGTADSSKQSTCGS